MLFLCVILFNLWFNGLSVAKTMQSRTVRRSLNGESQNMLKNPFDVCIYFLFLLASRKLCFNQGPICVNNFVFYLLISGERPQYLEQHSIMCMSYLYST
jgi:hypothetical protein